MKGVLIVGAKGNMGRRYGAVMDALRIPHFGVDCESGPIETLEAMRSAERILIATPTPTHATLVTMALALDKPVMVEKPLSTDPTILRVILEEARRRNAPLQMVNQYKFMGISPLDEGPTIYDYWNHGKDGLAWDCISVVALARGNVRLGERSPIWICWLNGRELKQNKVDSAYVAMIDDWMSNPRSDLDYIESAHEKVTEYLRCKNPDRCEFLSESRPEARVLAFPTRAAH